MPIFGVEVSARQTGVDLAAVAAAGFSFAAVKASEGATYRNPAWTAQYGGARAAGLLTLAYHYLSTEDPVRQAENCAAALGDVTVPVVLDWESGGGDWNNLLAVLAAFRAGGLHPVALFAPSWYWAGHGCPDVTATGLALWASRAPTGQVGPLEQQYAGVSGADWAPYGAAVPVLLQFTDAATMVGGHGVSASAYPGPREALAALLAARNTAPTPDLAPLPAAPSPATEEDTAVFVTTDPPPAGAAKADWPTRRFSFGFDPPGGFGGRCAVKLHFSAPGGYIADAAWFVRPPAPGFPSGGVGMPNAGHTRLGIALDGQQERSVGDGWELVPPECADELDVTLAAPGGVHVFVCYER